MPFLAVAPSALSAFSAVKVPSSVETFAFVAVNDVLVTAMVCVKAGDILSLCHLDRLRGSSATEEEWRDPENFSYAMLTQGVSTRALSLSSGFAESRAYALAVFLTNSSVFSALSAFFAVRSPVPLRPLR
jgi:hypothetical protein